MTRAEVWLLIQSILLLPVVASSLRLVGFRKTYHWLHRPLVGEANDDVNMVSRSVDRAAHNLPGFNPTCLPRSLTLWHLLRRRGTPAQLQIGVAKIDGQLAAHAWVESDGKVVNDRPDIAQYYPSIDFQYIPSKGA